MKKIFLFLLFLSQYNLIYSQCEVKAYVIDDNQTGVPFANISLKNNPIGTCSNEKGYFRFVIDSVYIEDTIVISCIGYNNRYFTLKDLSEKDSVFFLKPAKYEIKAAIIINDAPTVDEIIKRVIKNYNRNYPKTSFQAKAFFQDIVYNIAENADQKVMRITEAAISIQDYGTQTNKDVRFKVDELRNSKNFGETSLKMEWLIKLVFGGLQNPIDEMYNKLDLRKKTDFIAAVNEHNLSLEGIDFLDTVPVYVIKFEPKEVNDAFEYNYKLFINTKNYAIIKEDFYKKMSSKFCEMMHVTNCDNRRKIKLYREYNGKYYPNLIEYYSQVGDQGVMWSRENWYVRHSYILVNEIFPKRKDFKNIKWREKEDENDILYDRKFNYNKSFWNHFNVLYTQEEVCKAKEVLAKEDAIEKQFLENSK